MRPKIIFIIAFLLLLPSRMCFAQFPQSVICQFEKIAIADLDTDGKIVTSSEKSEGDMAISNLNSEMPIATGNMDTTKLQILRRSKDTIWLAEYPDNENVGVFLITLFFKTGIIMTTKHETINGKPFGFVEIGRFRTLK